MKPSDALNVQVSEEILRAEAVTDQKSEAARALWKQVSDTEAKLAELHPADDLEGEIARVGAVTAAIKANDYLRARELVAKYESEVPKPSKSIVTRMRKELRRAVPRG